MKKKICKSHSVNTLTTALNTLDGADVSLGSQQLLDGMPVPEELLLFLVCELFTCKVTAYKSDMKHPCSARHEHIKLVTAASPGMRSWDAGLTRCGLLWSIREIYSLGRESTPTLVCAGGCHKRSFWGAAVSQTDAHSLGLMVGSSLSAVFSLAPAF